VEDDDEAFADQMPKLTAQLGEPMARGAGRRVTLR
jgi:hypothetical protein